MANKSSEVSKEVSKKERQGSAPLQKNRKKAQRRLEKVKILEEKVKQEALRAKQKAKKRAEFAKKHPKLGKIRNFTAGKWNSFQSERAKHVHLHKSFKRSYREDYVRDFRAPGLLSHAMKTFKLLFKYWRTFLPLILIAVIFDVVLAGLMSEELYQQAKDTLSQPLEDGSSYELGSFAKAGIMLISTVTTGGLDSGMDEVGTVFVIMVFLIIWLTVIYLLRHFLAGRKPRLRDGLYNACAPIISTALVFAVIFIQMIPIFLVIITYNAALVTDFLSTPFYALVYFIFAGLMLLLSGYLLSSSIIALVAVTAPGMYPVRALNTAADLMAGRRIKFIIRVIYLIIVVAIIYLIVMMPVILIDMWLKSVWDFISGWPVVSFTMLVTTCFVFVYATIYIYLYYRWMLDYREE